MTDHGISRMPKQEILKRPWTNYAIAIIERFVPLCKRNAEVVVMASVHVGQHACFVTSRISDSAVRAIRKSGLGVGGDALSVGELRR